MQWFCFYFFKEPPYCSLGPPWRRIRLRGSVVKNWPANAGDARLILGWEDPLEKEMATDSSILAWEIPQTEEPGTLQPGVAELDVT